MPTATYIALGTFTAAGTETSVTFSSIPATYRDLVVQGNIKGDTDNGVVNMELNGDTNNRTAVRMFGTGSGSGGSDSGSGDLLLGAIGTGWATLFINIMDYSATDKHKTILARNSKADQIVIATASRWASTNAVTSVKITSNRTFQSGMTLSLYGIIS